jgi:hypothetical protein
MEGIGHRFVLDRCRCLEYRISSSFVVGKKKAGFRKL